MTLITHSPAETEAAGETLGALLRQGDIVALTAPLGAGKTVFTKGIARALGVEEIVTSPSYTIISEYTGADCPLYHIDAYRLSGSEDFSNIGGEEQLFGSGICVIEWSERIVNLLPARTINVHIEIRENGEREIHYEDSR